MSSTLKVDILQDSGGNNLVTSNGSGVITSAGFGKIGQVLQAVKTDTQTFSTTATFADITGLSQSITPSSTSSKILIKFGIYFGNSEGSINLFRLLRGTTAIGLGDADGDRTRVTAVQYPGSGSTAQNNVVFHEFLDEPSTTSATTYKLQMRYENGSAFINRNSRNNNSSTEGRPISTITLMEILP